MTRLTDGKKTVEISLKVWENNGYTPDWSMDFFEVGQLPYDDEKDAYIVEDVDYCIEYAIDWKNRRGDFSEDTDEEDRAVFVND